MKRIILLVANSFLCITLFSCYTSNPSLTHTVTFNSNGGTEIASQTIKDGECAVKPDNPTISTIHYAFDNWYLDDETFKNAYDFSTPVTSDITLYANYEQDEFPVTFNYYNGDKSSTIYCKKNKKITPPEDPIFSTYTFEKWHYMNSQGEYKEFNFDETQITSELSLYAQWSEHCYFFFNSNGGTNIIPKLFETNTVPKAPIAPRKKGFKCVGWYQNPDFIGEPYDFSKFIPSKVTSVILYAKYVKAYSVIFASNCPHGITSQLIPEGENAIQPVTPYWDGHQFINWYESETFDCNPFDFSTPITYSLTLYAKWDPPK